MIFRPYTAQQRDTLKTNEALDERSCRDPAYPNRLVEGTIFGMSNIIFHSARDGKSVLISVCETHLQPTRETVHAGGKHTHIDARTYTHTAAKKFVKKYLCQLIRRCGETMRDGVGGV